MKVTCIVASAGKGKRMGFKEDKPFVMLGEKPILFYTLKALAGCASIDDIIVVVSRNRLEKCKELVKKYGLNKIRAVIHGGKRRFDSVKNGLRKIGDADFILIHDGVRPFIDERGIKSLLIAAGKFGASLLANPSKETLKLINKKSFVVKTPKRKFLWEAQTPQAFRKDLILEAYKRAKDKNATDDASLVENLGYKVKIVKGSYRNIKITTREDLELAKILIRNLKQLCE